MNRNRVTKFLFGGFALVVLILALVFSLISCDTQPASAPVMDSAIPTAPIASEASPVATTEVVPTTVAPETPQH